MDGLALHVCSFDELYDPFKDRIASNVVGVLQHLAGGGGDIWQADALNRGLQRRETLISDRGGNFSSDSAVLPAGVQNDQPSRAGDGRQWHRFLG